jgi:hypothetical protein
MHEEVVAEITTKLEAGEKFGKDEPNGLGMEKR